MMEGEEMYRRLRRNYENNYRFVEAGDFIIREMEMRKLNVTAWFTNKKLKKIELWIKKNLSLLGIYKYLFRYGESYWRPIIFAIVIIFLYQ